ncbi:MAG: NADPH-dependent reductase [Micavibrio sp.]|nr:NADPH-dependent reductase [Micavibrio sp.]
MNTPFTAIVYHSGYGHTEVLAQAVERGAAKAGKTALIKISPEGKITDAEWETLNAADAIIFGAPTYMGSASGPFKMFADASSGAWFKGAWKDKIAGGFTNSYSLSGDKLATLQQMSILAAQHGMLWVSTGLPAAQKKDADHNRDENDLNRLGRFLGVMAQSENAGPEITPPQGDQKTGEHYGERIATFAGKLKAA